MSVRAFRVISVLEGLSFLVLLGVAMPLKYVAGNAEAVTHAGRIHGGLFVLFVIALYRVATEDGWRSKQVVTALICAVVPFGSFWLERQIRHGAFG